MPSVTLNRRFTPCAFFEGFRKTFPRASSRSFLSFPYHITFAMAYNKGLFLAHYTCPIWLECSSASCHPHSGIQIEEQPSSGTLPEPHLGSLLFIRMSLRPSLTSVGPEISGVHREGSECYE